MVSAIDKIPRYTQLTNEFEEWRAKVLDIFNKYNIKGKNCWITQGRIVGMREFTEWNGGTYLAVYFEHEHRGSITKYLFDKRVNESYSATMKKEIMKELQTTLDKKRKLIDRRVKETMELLDFIEELGDEGFFDV